MFAGMPRTAAAAFSNLTLLWSAREDAKGSWRAAAQDAGRTAIPAWNGGGGM